MIMSPSLRSVGKGIYMQYLYFTSRSALVEGKNVFKGVVASVILNYHEQVVFVLTLVLGMLVFSYSVSYAGDIDTVGMSIDVDAIDAEPLVPSPPNLQGLYSPLVIDGVSLGKQGVIGSFLQVAFSDTLWLENSTNATVVISDLLEDEYSQKIHNPNSWAYRFVDPSKGYPKHNVVNKWTEKVVRVGIGWPAFTGDMFDYFVKPSSAVPQFLPQIIRDVVANIKKKTGVDLRFTPPNSDLETTEDFARIRIVPIGSTGLKNHFKSFISDMQPGVHGHGKPPLIERLIGGVEFTPYSRSQVDGFILPNPDNSIGLAVCRISNSVTEKNVVTALVTECLLRSLGLPSAEKYVIDSFLGPWNRAMDPFSKVPYYDGHKAYVRRMHLDYSQAGLPKKIQAATANASITQFDALMVSLLYSPAVEPGMDKISALLALVHDGEYQKIVDQVIRE